MFAIAAWGVTAILSAVLAGFLAGGKNRDYSYWMAWSFLVPPMLLILLFLPRWKGVRPRRPTLDELDRHDSFL